VIPVSDASLATVVPTSSTAERALLDGDATWPRWRFAIVDTAALLPDYEQEDRMMREQLAAADAHAALPGTIWGSNVDSLRLWGADGSSQPQDSSRRPGVIDDDDSDVFILDSDDEIGVTY